MDGEKTNKPTYAHLGGPRSLWVAHYASMMTGPRGCVTCGLERDLGRHVCLLLLKLLSIRLAGCIHTEWCAHESGPDSSISSPRIRSALARGPRE